MSKSCHRRCLVAVEAGCQEEAQKKKAEKTRRKRRPDQKEESGMK